MWPEHIGLTLLSPLISFIHKETVPATRAAGCGSSSGGSRKHKNGITPLLYGGVMSDDDQNRQSIVIVGRLKGHTRVDDRDIYLVDIPGYIDWVDWYTGGD